MTTNRTLTATLPDGQAVSRNTPNEYEYVVALQVRGVWGDHTWTLDLEAAELIEADLKARIEAMGGADDYAVAIVTCWDILDPEEGIK